ncbi:hypothetical protein L207DRAFT_577606 [Hyaloscypha variabilis F]|uniref:Uncharacterized protein n=1 Tax=Hyaloscypha variabilis (strain UAMH 11265 / GT02V1 / F) TaxID=1149755 RepID=A0A2J6S7N3_HYAVF|nr:hypothetical protein L207DRAFT_577606 [Hyaloscypha variabilis F]
MPPLQTLTPFPTSASPSTPFDSTTLYANPQSTTSLSPSTPSLLTDDINAALPLCEDEERPLLITSSVKDPSPNPTTHSDATKGFSSSVQKTDTTR